MDGYSMDYPIGNTQTKKELQGPRPTPLKVRKDSHKIKKPPLHEHQSSSQQQQQQQQQQKQQQHVVNQYYYRPPVIIYTVSPKVIHTDPNDFMTLVQRLTGSSSSSSISVSSSSSSYDYYSNNHNNNDRKMIRIGSSYRDGEVSPAARYATTEKAKSPQDHHQGSNIIRETSDGYNFVDAADAAERRSNLFQGAAAAAPGILSPGPASLPRIQTDCMFSPITSRGTFFHDLSPYQHQQQYQYPPVDHQDHLSTFLNNNPNSPLNIITTSPIHSIDLFNHFVHY